MENNEKIELIASNILLEIGIPSSVLGSRYIVKAVIFSIENAGKHLSLSGGTYPFVAIEFGTRASRVERAIRHAISIACDKQSLTRLNQIFGVNIYSPTDRPSNSEFIALLADRIPYLMREHNY